MKKNQLIVYTGLAVAAVAGILGATRDRWLGERAPHALTGTAVGQGGQTTATEQGVATGQSTATQTQPSPEATTAAEQTVPAAAATTTEQAPIASASTETPAATTEQTPAASGTTTTEVAATTSVKAPAASTTTTAAANNSASAAASTETATPAQKPTFDTVRVEKTGEAVIAGRAASGSEVTVMLDGQSIGSATANSEGAFVVVPEKALPAGSGSLTIESKAANKTDAVKSDESVAVIVPATDAKQEALVAVISPDAPTKVLQKATPAEVSIPLSLDAVDYDAKGNIVFNGRAAAGSVARLYVDNALAGDAQANTEGRWTFTGAAAMAPGNHMLRVDAVDATGKVTSRVELPFVREDQTKVAEATPNQTQQQAVPAAAESQTQAATTTATETPAIETRPKEGRVIIQPGNNLWRISKVIYGSGTKYSVIFEANKDIIKNPDRIYPGQIFKTPDVVPPEQIDPKRREPLTPDESAAAAQ